FKIPDSRFQMNFKSDTRRTYDFGIWNMESGIRFFHKLGVLLPAGPGLDPAADRLGGPRRRGRPRGSTPGAAGSLAPGEPSARGSRGAGTRASLPGTRPARARDPGCLRDPGGESVRGR